MSGLKIETFPTDLGRLVPTTATRLSYLKENEYEVYVQILHPYSAREMSALLKMLSDKIREKEDK